MKCSFCEEDSIVSLLVVSGGNLDTKFFCEGHLKDNPPKETRFHIEDEPDEMEMPEDHFPVGTEDPIKRFEKLLSDNLKDVKEVAAKVLETDKDLQAMIDEAVQKEEFDRAAELKQKLDEKKNAQDNTDM